MGYFRDMKTKYKVKEISKTTGAVETWFINDKDIDSATNHYYARYHMEGNVLVSILPMAQERKAGWIPCAVVA
jgi:hypothetical protein